MQSKKLNSLYITVLNSLKLSDPKISDQKMESDMNSYNQYEDFFWKENMSLKST